MHGMHVLAWWTNCFKLQPDKIEVQTLYIQNMYTNIIASGLRSYQYSEHADALLSHYATTHPGISHQHPPGGDSCEHQWYPALGSTVWVCCHSLENTQYRPGRWDQYPVHSRLLPVQQHLGDRREGREGRGCYIVGIYAELNRSEWQNLS